MRKESDIQREILKALNLLTFAWPVKNTGTHDKKMGGYRPFHGAHGVPDISCIIPDGSGRTLYMEVKSEKGTLTEYQESFHDQLQKHNVPVVVVRSVGEALDALEESKNG